MEITKEGLEELRKSPFAEFMCNLMGLDLDDVVAAGYEELKKNEKPVEKTKESEKDGFSDMIKKVLDDMEREGTIKSFEKNGEKYYYSASLKEPPIPHKEEKKEYVKPESKERSFLMTESQLEKFIKAYRELLDAEKKLSYMFGIEFGDGGSGFSFTSKVNDIIWNFVRIIFGDENADDIADYIFGSSNFDSVKNLYEELV